MSFGKRGPRFGGNVGAPQDASSERRGGASGLAWQSRWCRTRFVSAPTEAGEKHRAAWRSGAHGADTETTVVPAWRRNIGARSQKSPRRS